jgi:hypothetical protein
LCPKRIKEEVELFLSTWLPRNSIMSFPSQEEREDTDWRVRRILGTRAQLLPNPLVNEGLQEFLPHEEGNSSWMTRTSQCLSTFCFGKFLVLSLGARSAQDN